MEDVKILYDVKSKGCWTRQQFKRCYMVFEKKIRIETCLSTKQSEGQT